MNPELIADYACVVGEGPMWHPHEKCVYWIDIEDGRLFRYDPVTRIHGLVLKTDVIGGYTIQADGALLLFMARGAVKIYRNGELTTVIDEIADERESRFNDVFADPVGRVYCGTMPTPDRKGRLYRLDPDRSLTLMLEDISCSNGMGLTPDLKHMYYTDSEAYKIYLFDYDQSSGALTNQRIFAQNPKEDGLPDGMTVDTEGCVWSARWDGHCLVRYSPTGQELQRIQFPVSKVSSIIFGGEDYTDMYVTTAGGNEKEKDGVLAGSLFRLNLGIKGVPEFFSRISA